MCPWSNTLSKWCTCLWRLGEGLTHAMCLNQVNKVERVVHNPVDLMVEVPRPVVVEKTVEVPKIQIEERTIKVPKVGADVDGSCLWVRSCKPWWTPWFRIRSRPSRLSSPPWLLTGTRCPSITLRGAQGGATQEANDPGAGATRAQGQSLGFRLQES